MEMNKFVVIAGICGVVLLVLAILAIVVVVALAAKKKNEKPEIQTNRMNVPPVVKQQTAVKYSLEDQNLHKVAAGIRKSPETFTGLYEGVFQIACDFDNVDSDAIDEWKIRVGNMNGNDEFRNAFINLMGSDNVKSQAVKLLNCIELAGVKRAAQTEYAFELNANKKYVCLSGNKLDEGTVCTVLRPYWSFDGRVVEQGCIVRKDV